MKIIGIQEVNFKAENGDQIIGTSIFVTKPITNNGEGEQFVGKYFISQKAKQNSDPFMLGDEINIYFNEYQKVSMVKII